MFMTLNPSLSGPNGEIVAAEDLPLKRSAMKKVPPITLMCVGLTSTCIVLSKRLHIPEFGLGTSFNDPVATGAATARTVKIIDTVQANFLSEL